MYEVDVNIENMMVEITKWIVALCAGLGGVSLIGLYLLFTAGLFRWL